MLKYYPAALILAFAGCGHVAERVAEHTDTMHIDLDKSEMVRVEMAMGAGQLRLHGSTSKLMDGYFKYHGIKKPELRYEPSSFRSRLSIRCAQSNDKNVHVGGIGEDWDVRLNE